MTGAIPNNPLASSIAGTDNAARRVQSEKKRSEKSERPRRTEDTFEQAEQVTEIDPARTVKGNTDEEAHEDRQEHGTDGVRDERPKRGLDLSA
ncbi:MAG: hypothetical protein AAGI53_00775 [Planctomycetota bacterium]